jgi:hypothetical protein
MWLDAFIKPNSADMQKARVGRVVGVETARKPNEYKGLAKSAPENSAVLMRVDGVENREHLKQPTPPTPDYTATIAGCLYEQTARKPNEYKGLAIRPTPPTPPTPQKHNVQEIAAPNLEALKQFRFDLVRQEIEDGHPADELHRVNNMAWEFMQVDGMAFDEAIKLAGEIVAHAQIAACEAAYIDVMALFKKVSQ